MCVNFLINQWQGHHQLAASGESL